MGVSGRGLLGGLFDALAGSWGRKAVSSSTQEPTVERLPPRRRAADEVAAAEAETRRMMREAAREMEREFPGAGAVLRGRHVEDAESTVIDIDSTVLSPPERTRRSLDETNRRARGAKEFRARPSVLIALAFGLLAVLIVTFWLVSRS